MKRRLLSFILTFGLVMTTAIPVIADDDYSYLDDMTINELKKLDEEIHKRIPSSSTPQTIYTVVSDEETEDEVETIIFDEPITAMDNDYVKVDFTGKYVDYKDRELGYKITAENKTDKYLHLVTSNASIDGYMLDSSAGPYISFYSLAPKSKAEGEYYIPIDGRKIGVELTSLDDLVNFNCVFQISWSEDGSTINSNDMVKLPLSCIVP